MFVSGLSFSGETEKDAERLFSLDLLQKWIGGYLPLCNKVPFYSFFFLSFFSNIAVSFIKSRVIIIDVDSSSRLI